MSGSLEQQRGVGLIEILITMLILSTALMGLAALQTRSLQYNQDSYFRSQANIMAFDILDRTRIYTSPNDTWVDAAGASKAALPQAVLDDIVIWNTNIGSSLPNGSGTLTCDMATRLCTATITWSEQNKDKKKDGTDELQSTFTYTAKL